MKSKPFPAIPWSNRVIYHLARFFAENAADRFDEHEGHPPLCFVFPKGKDSTLVDLDCQESRQDKVAYYRKLGEEIRDFLGCRPVGIITAAEAVHCDSPDGKNKTETLDILVEHKERQPFMARFPIQVLVSPEGDMKRRVDRSGVRLGYGWRDHRSLLGHFVLGPGKVDPRVGPRPIPNGDFNFGAYWKWLPGPEKKDAAAQTTIENTGTPTLSESKNTKT